ncbi:hypothetical protein [Rhizobium leguminosarum]|uniref:hypothetical protein n=1 Tax=Rhizobium leguminosarum TaxID=384 RepID=UPI003CC86B7B
METVKGVVFFCFKRDQPLFGGFYPKLFFGWVNKASALTGQSPSYIPGVPNARPQLARSAQARLERPPHGAGAALHHH